MEDITKKEGIDCELSVTRSFDVFFDEDHAREMKEFVLFYQAQGTSWAGHIKWIDAYEGEKVSFTSILWNLKLPTDRPVT